MMSAPPSPILHRIQASTIRPGTLSEAWSAELTAAKTQLFTPVAGSRSAILEWLTREALTPFMAGLGALVSQHTREREPLPTTGQLQFTFSTRYGEGTATLDLDQERVEVRVPSPKLQGHQPLLPVELTKLSYAPSDLAVLDSMTVLTNAEQLTFGGQPLTKVQQAAWAELAPSAFEPKRPKPTLAQWGGQDHGLVVDERTRALVFSQHQPGLREAFQTANAQ